MLMNIFNSNNFDECRGALTIVDYILENKLFDNDSLSGLRKKLDERLGIILDNMFKDLGVKK